jgi:transcriptional regulator with XRE-family HTH domain
MQHIENYFNNLDQIIGKKIYFLRLDNNMSQAEMAKKIGISAQQLQKYGNAKNRISTARLALIAKVLDKDISYFYQSYTGKLNLTPDVSIAQNISNTS